jgi:hypothetical protein
VTFDPFGDFATKGYLRNFAGETDRAIVRKLEHTASTTGLDAALEALAFGSARDALSLASRPLARFAFARACPDEIESPVTKFVGGQSEACPRVGTARRRAFAHPTADNVSGAPGLDGQNSDVVLGKTDDAALKAEHEAQRSKRKDALG